MKQKRKEDTFSCHRSRVFGWLPAGTLDLGGTQPSSPPSHLCPLPSSPLLLCLLLLLLLTSTYHISCGSGVSSELSVTFLRHVKKTFVPYSSSLSKPLLVHLSFSSQSLLHIGYHTGSVHTCSFEICICSLSFGEGKTSTIQAN